MADKSPQPESLEGLRVTIDRIVYQRLPESASPDLPHSFVYFISIHNDSDLTVTLKGRKWVVRHDDGTSLVVEGDGVVGEFPVIPPGEKFSYNSRHVFATRTATAEGAYLGLDETGRRIVVRIPLFKMIVPQGEFDEE
jgi:ApaG protein